MTTYLALLRAVNVGGKNKLPMPELRAALTEAGLRDVRTYIQSGNIIFATSAADRTAVADLIAAVIRDRFGVESPVVLRTRAELAAALDNVPYPADEGSERSQHILFLADEPTPARVAALDPNRSPGDEFTVVGKDIYLRFGESIARSKLTNAYFDATLGTVSTARNLRTSRVLLEKLGGAE